VTRTLTHASLQSRLRERLERAPERRALAFYAPDGEFAWVRFDETYRRAAGLAAVLAEQGLGRGDVGMIVLPSGELSAMTTLAVLLRGAVPLLVAPPIVAGSLLDLPRVLKRTARETRARVVVCSETMAGMRAELESDLPGTRFLFDLKEPGPGGVTDRPPVLPASTDVAAMQLTSGTTGFPRICVWDQRAVLAALDGMVTAMNLSERDVCLNWTPLYHDMGLVNNFLLCITSGVPLVMLGPEEFVKRPALWARGLSDTEATVTWSPNFGFALAARRVADRDLDGVRLDRVRALWNAAERIHHGTILEFCRRYEAYGLTPEAVKTNFGCAENIGGATFSDPDGHVVVEHVDGDGLFDTWVARTVADGTDVERATAVVGVGKPHPAIRIEILSDEGKPLPEGHVGEIALDTPSRMRGYLNDADATQRALHGDLVCTGDLGYLRGDELFWVGRTQERINIRGKKLDPSDFEPVLFDVAGLREGCFAAFGVDDEEEGTQRVVIVSEVREPFGRDADDVAAEIQKQTFLRLGVTVHEVLLVRPRTLAKTSSGKRRHRHFRQLYLDNGLESYRV
jgi:acyl-CoA synthetase (AMP-forming)/AMP-acid ligase II